MRRAKLVAATLERELQAQFDDLVAKDLWLAQQRQRLAALAERLSEGRDGAGAECLAVLREQTRFLRQDCLQSWQARLRDWSRNMAELRKGLEQVGELAALGELSAAIAHEIRNPLCGMLLLVGVLQTKMDQDDSRRRILESLQKEAERMEKMVNNLLCFARRYQPRPVPCELGALVRQSIESVRSHLASNETEVELDVPDAGCEAEVDPDLMQQVFRNILVNAIDASPRGSPLQVRLERLEEPHRISVAFTDRGKGIPGEDMERIFEPFFTSKHTGVGLGLSVSKKIVEAHNGRIEVASTRGQGTTFTVVFPCKAARSRQTALA